MSSFNIFGSATKKDIRVGYVDPDRGYVQNVSILEANRYAALNPGTVFIFSNRDKTRYLTINEVNALTPDVLEVDGNVCEGIQGLKPNERPPFTSPFGSGGTGDGTGTTGGTGGGTGTTGGTGGATGTTGGTGGGTDAQLTGSGAYDDGCRGRLYLSGGGGVGAVGSPIFGRDGSLLAVRVLAGGFGYRYEPKAKLIDTCKRGSGAVIRTVIGELPPTVEYFDQIEDFEVYDFTPDGTELSGYGNRFGPNGEDLGAWDPNLFATLAQDPIGAEIQRYQEFLRQGINPFWHTRKENPLSVTFRDKTSRVIHKVTDKGYRERRRKAGVTDDFGWSDWMNKYAVSPVPESNAPGSDYAGRVATMEWEEDFPYTGEYVFRGMADNIGKLYLDNELLIQTGQFGGLNAKNVQPKNTVRKTVQEGVHRIKVDLFNIPRREKPKPKKPQDLTITYHGLNRGSTRTSGERKYPIEFEKLNPSNRRIEVSGNNSRHDNNTLKLRDGKGSDANVKFTILSSSPGVNARFSDDGRELEVKGSGDVTIRLKYDDNPGYAGEAVRSITIAGTKWTKKRTEYGEETKTIKVSGGGGTVPANVKLRNAGERTVQMEDYKDNDWSDLVVTSSAGRFFDIKGNKAKFTAGPGLSATTIRKRDGVTYSGPDLIRHNNGSWSKFMNKNNVSPFIPPLDEPNPAILGFRTFTWNNVNFSEEGRYRIRFQSDNAGSVFINNTLVSSNKGFRGDPSPEFINLKPGRYTIRVELENAPPNLIFNNNPTGLALKIDTPIQVPNASKPWKNNPIGISAVLISPPCPRRIDGKGLVTDVIVEDPGSGFFPPADGPGGYPVLLKLKEVLVKDTGINYNCGVDELTIEPANGAELEYECDTFGRIKNINVINPGVGFTETPIIRMPSRTGVNFKAVPLFEVERDPVAALTGEVPLDKLVQVTDLVGLKQTGYVDGRAYYGAVFYKDGIRYAGYFETAGQQIQVYDTLQESIDAEVTTDPSAILRQGTDTNSNNPRLDIPGTPDELI